MGLITLQKITEDNFEECIALDAGVVNDHFVDPVAYSLAEAWVAYHETKPFAIYNGEQMVGYVSLYIGDAHYQITNFFIDHRFQGRGFGTAAAQECIKYLVDEYGAKKISLPVDPDNAAAIQVWASLDFVLTDDKESGYQYMRWYLEGGN